MDVTRRCDYACRILRAAYKSGENYISVSDIAEAEDIPYAFARSIQHDLVKGGIVKTVRGAHGGLALNCDPAEVTLLEILEAVQGPVSVAMCATDPDYCGKQPECAYHQVWLGADKLLNDYFAAFTLADLLDQGQLHPTIVRVLGEEFAGVSYGSAEDRENAGKPAVRRNASSSAAAKPGGKPNGPKPASKQSAGKPAAKQGAAQPPAAETQKKAVGKA